MKALHVNGGRLFGGVETFQLALLAAARTHTPGTEHRFALVFDGRFLDALRAKGAAVEPIGAASLSKPWTVARTGWNLRRLLLRTRPDVVVLHSSWTAALFLPVLRTVRVPVVLTLHNALGTGWPDRVAQRLRPDGVIAVSAAVRQSWQGVLARWRCPAVVIHCPVPPPPAPALAPEPRGDGEGRRGAVRILLAARMQAWKGHAALLEALGLMRDELGWQAQIAGGPQNESERGYFAALQAQAQALGIGERVAFLGQRDDVPALLAASDIYCQPNLEPEGLGLSLVEAMAHGLPVVTSRLGPAEEVVGEAGILLPAGDTTALAQALRKLVRSYPARARYRTLGPAQAKKLCDPEARVRDTEAFLRRVVEARAPAAARR